jgi:hypothetical protein
VQAIRVAQREARVVQSCNQDDRVVKQDAESARRNQSASDSDNPKKSRSLLVAGRLITAGRRLILVGARLHDESEARVLSGVVLSGVVLSGVVLRGVGLGGVA